jgi:hypothetical protein
MTNAPRKDIAASVRDRFVLKGAMLFATWADAPFRATGDVDFLSFGDPGVETTKSAFIGLCELKTDVDDGLTFPSHTVVVERTREEEDYQGLHVRFEARLKNIRIPILIDIGFGDVIHPAALDIDYPRLPTRDGDRRKIRRHGEVRRTGDTSEGPLRRVGDFEDVCDLPHDFRASARLNHDRQ